MIEEKYRKHIFLTSFVLTVIIFTVGLILNYLLDFARVDEVVDIILNHELDTEAYLLEKSFIDTFGGNKCNIMKKRIYSLKEEIRDVGTDLSKYGSLSFFKKRDFDYLKRKYFLLELKFLTLIEELNKQCGRHYIPIIFFFKIDDDLSERQGFILEEVSDGYRDKVVVVSLDKDYTDEPLVRMLVKKYNITTAPTTIIDNRIVKRGVTYSGEINASLRLILRKVDPHAKGYNFSYVLNVAGIPQELLIKELKSLQKSPIDYFSKGDISLIIGRLLHNDTIICASLKYYDKVNSDVWNKSHNKFRARILRQIALGKKPKLVFDIRDIPNYNLTIPKVATQVSLGKSSITITKDDLIVSQVDRVSRDWLSAQLNYSPFSNNLLTTFSERWSYSPKELLPSVGWHEGARIKELETVGAKHITSPGTIVAKHNGRWYAPDERGVFRFEVPIDKILYPTTRFLDDNIAVIVDTHGLNMLVEQAIHSNATVVIGCCDNPSKVKAAIYLAEHDKKVICFTDKYLPLALGSNHTILGSPPLRKQNDTYIIGDQIINFSTTEVIIVEDVDNINAVQSYYDTPARYFRKLEEQIPLNTVYVPVQPNDKMSKLVDAANAFDAHVIAARVFDSDDYNLAKKWLKANTSNRMILFHSVSYPYGYKLLREFPNQTSFDDINPVVS